MPPQTVMICEDPFEDRMLSIAEHEKRKPYEDECYELQQQLNEVLDQVSIYKEEMNRSYSHPDQKSEENVSYGKQMSEKSVT